MATDFGFPTQLGFPVATDWMKSVRRFFGFERDVLEWEFAEDAVPTLQYLGRLDHLHDPDPALGEVVSGPNTCFLVRTYSGEREMLWVDTEAGEVNPLSFLAVYRGRRESYPDMEIGTPKQY